MNNRTYYTPSIIRPFSMNIYLFRQNWYSTNKDDKYNNSVWTIQENAKLEKEKTTIYRVCF